MQYPVFANAIRDSSGGVRALFRSISSGLGGEGMDAAEDAAAAKAAEELAAAAKAVKEAEEVAKAAAAKAAEEAGFDMVCTMENRHDPFLALGVAAVATEKIALGTAVAIAFPRSPMVVANACWDLQVASKG